MERIKVGECEDEEEVDEQEAEKKTKSLPGSSEGVTHLSAVTSETPEEC